MFSGAEDMKESAPYALWEHTVLAPMTFPGHLLSADGRCSLSLGTLGHGLEFGHTWFPPLASCHSSLSFELSALSD